MRFINILISALFIWEIFSGCEKVQSPTGLLSVKDVTAPRVQIISPHNGDSTKEYLEVEFIASDPSGIQKTEVKLDDYTMFGMPTNTGKKYSYRTDVSEWGGHYTLSVTAYDYYENVSTTTIDLYVNQVVQRIAPGGKEFSGYEIYEIAQDKNGTLWFTSRYGLIKSDGKTFTLNPSGFNPYRPQLGEVVTDGMGNIWMEYQELYTGGQQLIVYNGSSLSYLYPPVDVHLGSLTFDSHDTLWGCWNASLFTGFFKFKDSVWTIYYPENIFGDYSIKVNDMTIDRNDNKWFVARDAIRRFDGNQWSIYNNTNSNLPAGATTKVQMDKKGNIWAIVYDEIKKFDGTEWTVYSNFAGNNIISFAVDNNDIMWIGTQSGGVIKFDGQKILRRYSTESPDCMFVDQNNNVWVGTRYGIYKIKPN